MVRSAVVGIKRGGRNWGVLAYAFPNWNLETTVTIDKAEKISRVVLYSVV